MRTSRTPVAIYSRYSTDEQDPRSIDDQIRRCTEHANGHDQEVVATFSDAAVSGAHTDRVSFTKMLDAVTATKRPPFRAVLVDDLSRLSRNIGDFWRVVDDLASAGITVVDVQTGMSSDDPNARSLFGMKSVFNDHFLQVVRYQTHRGLEGRAKAGFWTGGRIYGYGTQPEPNPSNPEHPRAVPVIEADEAVVVRRIYELFIGGAGLKSIADTLNRDCVRAPHDRDEATGAKTGNKGLRGWTHSTIRNVLRNERYIGRWTWNTTKWLAGVNKDGERVRRRSAKPRSEWVVREYPDLVIIDTQTWAAAHARLKRQTAHGGRPPGTGKSTYLVSGLLRCGTCGGSMSIIGGRVLTNGTRCVTFGCTTYYTRGSSICGNSLTISEKRITGALIESLRELFGAPEVVQRLTESIAAKVEKLAKPAKARVTPRMVAEVEARVRQLAENLARMPASAAMLEKLADEERRLIELKATKRSNDPGQIVKAPTETQVRRSLAEMVTTFESDPVAGREALAEMMSPITLTETKKPRGYRCRAEFRLPDSLGLSSRAEVSKKSSSGGRI